MKRIGFVLFLGFWSGFVSGAVFERVDRVPAPARTDKGPVVVNQPLPDGSRKTHHLKAVPVPGDAAPELGDSWWVEIDGRVYVLAPR